MRYVPETDTFYQGLELQVGTITFVCHLVTAEKGDYFDGKKIGISTYKKPNRRGVGFSFFEWSLLFLVKKEGGS